jgi:UDP:flavonoid glycosyltransferase YjiC (YdhE family)
MVDFQSCRRSFALRALLITGGSSGDVNPFLAVGQALRRRGHEVVVLVNPYYAQAVRDAGLETLPLGEPVPTTIVRDRPEIMGAWSGPTTLLRELVIPAVGQALRATENAIREVQPAVVVRHPICLGCDWIAQRHELPVATLALAPVSWFSAHDPSLYLPIDVRLPPWLTRTRLQLTRAVLRFMVDRPLYAVADECGLPRRRDVFYEALTGGDLNLGLWSPRFRGPAPDDPPQGRICGFAWYDRHRELETASNEIAHFLDDGDAPLVFTLGTAAVHVSGRFYVAAADACRRLGRRGLLLTGRSEYAPPDLPRGVRAFPYAPYSQVMPRAAANIHQGGIGTTAQALRSGRPMLVVPHAHDQFDNAARVRRLGTGLVLGRNRVSGRAFERLLSRLLDGAEFTSRAAKLGRSIAGECGAAQAAEAIEGAVRSPRLR